MLFTVRHTRDVPLTAAQSPLNAEIAEFAPSVVKPSDGAPEPVVLFEAPTPLEPRHVSTFPPHQKMVPVAPARVNVTVIDVFEVAVVVQHETQQLLAALTTCCCVQVSPPPAIVALTLWSLVITNAARTSPVWTAKDAVAREAGLVFQGVSASWTKVGAATAYWNWYFQVSCSESPIARLTTGKVADSAIFPTVDASNVPDSSTDRAAVAVIVPTAWYVSLVTVVVTTDSVPDARVSTSVERAVSVTAAVRAAPVAPTPIAMNFGGFVNVPGVVLIRSAAIALPLFVTTVAVPNTHRIRSPALSLRTGNASAVMHPPR